MPSAASWRASGIDFTYILTTPCATCGAKRGQPCRIFNRRRGGRRAMTGKDALWPHLARRKAYLERLSE